MSDRQSFPLAWWVDTEAEAIASSVDWVQRQPGIDLVSVDGVRAVEHHFLVDVTVERPPVHVSRVLRRPEPVSDILTRLERRGWQA